jgi:hypothetical protein
MLQGLVMKIGKGLPIAKYTLIEAYKRRFFLLFLVALLVSAGVSVYAASLAMLERMQTMAAFYGFIIRLCNVGLVGAYVILTESRTLDQPQAAAYFSLPLSRTAYLCNRLLGYLVLIVIVQIISLLPLSAAASPQILLLWALTSICELLIVVAVSLMLVTLFSQPVMNLFLFAVFYVFSRGSGEFWRHSKTLIADATSLLDQTLAWVTNLITYLVPRLGDFASASWLLRDQAPAGTAGSVVAQTALYAALLLLIAVERLQRRPL